MNSAVQCLRRHLLTLVIIALSLCGTASSHAGSVHEPDAAGFIVDVFADSTAFTEIATPFVNLGHGAANWGDYDADGDLDLLVTGIGGRLDSIPDASNPHHAIIYRNDGGSFSDVGAPLIGVHSNDGAFWADFDHDGDLDLFLFGSPTDSTGIPPVSKIYRNDNGTFVDLAVPIPGLIGTAAWGDYDSDGDLDLVMTGSLDLGSTFQTVLLRNDDSTFVEVPTGIPGAWGSSLDWGDYDNDGDLDLLFTGYGGGVRTEIYRNDDGSFTNILASIQSVDAGAARWGDYDNDGDLDILIVGTAPGGVTFSTVYRNDGGTFVDIHPGIAPVGGAALTEQFMKGYRQTIPSGLLSLVGVANSTAAWVDYDNDGDLDIILSGNTQADTMATIIYRNDGGGVFVDIQAGLVGVWYSALSFGDYDNDGDLDLIVSGFSRTSGATLIWPYWPWLPLTKLYRNNLGPANTKPSTPQNLSADQSGGIVLLQWDFATDGQTPQNALTYNIRVSTTPGGENRIAGMSNLADGFHRVARAGNTGRRRQFNLGVLAPGTYYWSVQSIDNTYAGSAFSDEQQLIVAAPAKWQMVSLSSSYADRRKSTLFPDAVSNAFAYHAGYVVQDSLMSGEGYWLKFPASVPPTAPSGAPLESLEVSLADGWNMIGGVDHDIPAPLGGIITSQCYAFNSGYSAAGSLEPGRGYWVKASTAGTILLGGSGALLPPVASPARNSITVTDAAGNVQTLRIVSTAPPALLDFYDAPPAPPAETFDVRFATGRYLAVRTMNAAQIVVSSPRYPLTVRWEIHDGGLGRLRLLVDSRMVELGAAGSIEIAKPFKSLALDLDGAASSATPGTFGLLQNYPNPFNPSTTISYTIRAAAFTTLKVFNLLGEEVASLVNELKAPGAYSVTWDPGDGRGGVSSGVYYCRMQSGGTLELKKMLLIR